MIFDNDRYHDTIAEIQFHHCFVCNEAISEYYYQQFESGLQIVCPFHYTLQKNYNFVTKQLLANV